MQDLLIIQHEADTPPGTVLNWAQERGLRTHIWNIATESAPCSPEDVKALLICGGSMDTFEESRYPWLIDEKVFIKKCVQRRIPVMGLCLGSQLLAEVLGGKVHPMNSWEIGFVPVQMRDQTTPYTLNVFHWHQCTFDLPPGGELMATNDFCRNQAFRWGTNVVATQFHPEATMAWIEECAEEVNEKHLGNVQTRKQMLESRELQKAQQDWFFRTLNDWYTA